MDNDIVDVAVEIVWQPVGNDLEIRYAKIQCPFCGETHFHSPGGPIDTRVPHCKNKSTDKEYRLVYST